MTREEIINEIKPILSELDSVEDAVSYLTQNDVKWLNENIKALEQEPCEDAISRQAVAEFLRDHSKDFEDARIKMAFMAASSLVENTEYIPPVMPTQRWIPVSEKLPEKSDRYLAYIVNEYDANYRYIMTCEYIANSYCRCWCPDDECASDNVVAWMPLPGPYKAESEDKG